MRGGISAAHAREQQLAGGVASAGQLLGTLDRQLAILEQRAAAVQAQLASDEAALAQLQAQTAKEQRLTTTLERRFRARQKALKDWLVSVYEDGTPNGLEVLLEANGFSDLLERINFLHRLSNEGATITGATRSARNAAKGATIKFAALTARQQSTTTAVAAERQALTSLQTATGDRRAAVARTQAIEREQLAATRARSAQLQHELNSELASLYVAPGGPPPPGTTWAIPWAIVQCESGGQNLPPNSAGASGYYQIIPATWSQSGGSGPAAYLAPKSEQDAVAARIWNGGAGASNWVCAALVHG